MSQIKAVFLNKKFLEWIQAKKWNKGERIEAAEERVKAVLPSPEDENSGERFKKRSMAEQI